MTRARRKPPASFLAYLDASGTADQGFALYVAGFISSEAKWRAFEREWLELLGRYDITGPFHMKDFAAGIGQFEPWKEDKGRRAAFMAEAARLIKRRTHKSFCSGIVLSEFREIQETYEVPEYLWYPFVLCSLGVIREVGAWIKRNDVVAKIAFVFEDGDKHRGKLYEALSAHGLGDVRPNFASKFNAVPLQAADLLAWELARLARDAFTATGRPLRG